ncbi:hypothetical protein MASR2M18_17390 [Ignavibacteria bacterium]|jgi:hypothetical protein|nr:hypothetical protein [Bacteroidota bacterium]MCZ2132004.1 hypothetical protein [Bacteroidota bacterium]
MKRFLPCSIIAALCVFCVLHESVAQNAAEMPQVKVADSAARRYTIKSAIITFENDADGQKSFVAMCFDDFGTREALETKLYIKQGSNYEQAHTLEIHRGDTLYLLNLEYRVGIQMRNKNAKSDRPDFSALTPKLMKSLGLIRNEPEEYLGKICDVYVMHNERANIHGKYLVWNNIVLRSEINADGIISTTRAVSIRDNAAVPEKNFEVPLDIIPEEKD